MPVVFGLGALVSSIQGTFYYLGGRIDTFKEEGDEFERKEILRRTTRVPIEQTLAYIGEGRGEHPPYTATPVSSLRARADVEARRQPGIKPPGYEERRRERIKEKYGFEINPVKATVDGSR